MSQVYKAKNFDTYFALALRSRKQKAKVAFGGGGGWFLPNFTGGSERAKKKKNGNY